MQHEDDACYGADCEQLDLQSWIVEQAEGNDNKKRTTPHEYDWI